MKTIYKVPDTVLLIENDPVAAENILRSLINGEGSGSKGSGKSMYASNNYDTCEQFFMEWVRTLPDATDLLTRRKVDVILLSLDLPGYREIDAVGPVLKAAPESSILVLCNSDKLETAYRAVQGGAADYLLYCQLDSDRLQKHIDLFLSKKSAA